MHDDAIRSEIRGTDAEDVLLAAEAAGGQLPHLGVVKAAGGDDSAGSYAAGTLRRLGLAIREQSVAGETTLTPQGRCIARAVLNSRRNGRDRWDAVERAIAVSVGNGGSWSLGEVAGIPVTENETRFAVSNLEKWGLVNAQRDSGDTILVVMPRDSIHQVPGVEGFLKDHFEGRLSYNDQRNMTNIGDGNTFGGVQIGGQGNTQTVTQTVTPDLRADVLARVDVLLQTLNDADGEDAELRSAVEAIREEAESDGATESGIKDRALQAFVVATTSGMGQLLVQGLAQLGRALTA